LPNTSAIDWEGVAKYVANGQTAFQCCARWDAAVKASKDVDTKDVERQHPIAHDPISQQHQHNHQSEEGGNITQRFDQRQLLHRDDSLYNDAFGLVDTSGERESGSSSAPRVDKYDLSKTLKSALRDAPVSYYLHSITCY
jgi:hypothetical protein